jgi:single-stranded-DNA-specific exonuclease
VDCGITAVEEVNYAKNIGLDMCITDHHECADVLPDAISIVNPKQKDDITFSMLAGVGVAFKCITALAKRYKLSDESYLKYLDIVAVGTISDIVPLVDENRIISKYGLEMMKETENTGLKSLLNIINFKTVDSQMVSFGMAPRINACGRMGNAEVAVKLLLENDKEKADELAIKLNEQNTKRQQVEKKIFDATEKMIQKNHLYLKNSIVLYNENWHNGVIGIVASRLVNIYYKPVILLTKENGVIRGSGRCPADFSLYDTLTKCKEYLIQFGGHELAAGLSIEEDKIEAFTNKFEQVVTESLVGEPKQIIPVDAKIDYRNLNIGLLKDINVLKPYGQANKEPIFMYKGLKVQSIRTIKEDKHLKLTLRDDKYQIEALAFSQGNRRDELRLGDKIDVLCNVDINTYTTPRTIQLILQDFKKAVN